jgi:hypothetical protein
MREPDGSAGRYETGHKFAIMASIAIMAVF